MSLRTDVSILENHFLLLSRKLTETAKGLYELKDECCKEYNCFFYHYARTEQVKVSVLLIVCVLFADSSVTNLVALDTELHLLWQPKYYFFAVRRFAEKKKKAAELGSR